MIYFNLQETAILRAVKWGKSPLFKHINVLKKIFTAIFFISFLLFLFGFFGQGIFSEKNTSFFFSLFLIFLSSAIFSFLLEAFFNSKLKIKKINLSLSDAVEKPEIVNLAQFLDFKSCEAVWDSITFSKKRKLSRIPSEALLYFTLSSKSPKINFIFYRGLINLKHLKSELKKYLDSLKEEEFTGEFSDDFKSVILKGAEIAQKRKKEKIGIGEILLAQAEIDPTLKKALLDSNLNRDDIGNLAWWFDHIEKKAEKAKEFWRYENLLELGSIAKDWAAGYTITLDDFSIDWSKVTRESRSREMIGHEKEISQMERILSREETKNVLLIGDPGAGRMKIVQELAKRITSNLSAPQVNSKRVVGLDMVSILAKSKSLDEAEEILTRIFDEAISAGNIILVIDDFHNFIGQTSQLGLIDISGLISSYLTLPNFRLIAVTNFPGFHRFIEPNPILNLFEKVEVEEISDQETILALTNFVFNFESKYKTFISYQALRDIVKYSSRYLAQIPFPKKAIDLLDEIVVYVVRYTKSNIVLSEHVARVVSDKTQIPVGEVALKEKEILLNLESLLHTRIIDQEEGIEEISTALRRARSDITVRKGPMGCFLFLGPTGVGKTETAKALADIYFGSESKMIRLDMSEFQAVKDISRLIGSSEEEGLLTTKVRENPFSLVLLDEIEKAHPNILNLFLQVLDEGNLTDGLGRKVSFLDTIIIATSNAGYKVILEALKEKTDWYKLRIKLLDFLFKEGVFRPEFINRFDSVVIFKPLSQENLLGIAELLLQKLKKNLKGKEIDFTITPELKKRIVEFGYDPIFGARQMRRVVQEKVENILAKAILSDEIKKGDIVEIEPKDFKLIINH
jgi:ATP-dependent Clp protease ATP-binding subunit ClpC